MRLCSFHRPSTTIIGHGDTIVLPKQSQRVTAEAELAVIIGRRCKDISVDEVPAVLLGFTTVLEGPHGATGNVVRRRDGETPRHADG